MRSLSNRTGRLSQAARLVVAASLVAVWPAWSAGETEPIGKPSNGLEEQLTLKDPMAAKPAGRNEFPRTIRLPVRADNAAEPRERSSRERTILRLTGMYYTALSEDRNEDAAALQEALTALGAPAPNVDDPRTTISLSPVRSPRAHTVPPTVGSLIRHLRGQDDFVVRVRVTGDTSGVVWGSNPYTDDSDIGTAAVHAGLAQPGKAADVVLRISGPGDQFHGSRRHEVQTSDYGPWDGSFTLTPADDFPDVPYLLPAPLSQYRGDYPADVDVRLSQFVPAELQSAGMTVVTHLTGHPGGSVWGSGMYTADSSLPAAALHAGVLRDGETGFVKIVLKPGRTNYQSTTRHGITTSSWQDYPLSFRLEAIKPARTSPAPRSSSSNFRPTF